MQSDKELVRPKIEKLLSDVAEKLNIKNFTIDLEIKDQTKDGFMGEFFFAAIKNKDTNDVINLAIKRAFEAKDNITKEAKEPAMEFNSLMGMAYNNEIVFYDQIAPAVQEIQSKFQKPVFSSLAKCCLTQDEPTPVLVFEDITKIGYKLFDKTQFFKKDHLEYIFKEYGKFHALSFVLKDQNKEEYNRLCSRLKDFSIVMLDNPVFAEMAIQSAKEASDFMDPEKDKVVKEHLQKYIENLVALYKEGTDYKGKYGCIVHGDCWSNNMMFKYSIRIDLIFNTLESMKILDWQLCRVGSPVHDLSYFFYTGAGKEDLDKLEDYLKLYHLSFSDTVKALGGNPDVLLPYDGLKEDWKKYSKFGLIMTICILKIKLSNQKEMAEGFKNTDVSKFMEKVEGEENPFSDMMKYDKNEFGTRMRDLVYHMLEIGAL